MLKITKIVILVLLSINLAYGQDQLSILASTDLTGIVQRSSWRVFSNQMGVSMQFQQMVKYINSTLFQKYHRNSFFYSDWRQIFHQTCHVKTGTRYRCDLVANLTSSDLSNCVTDINNETLIKTLGQYIWNTTNTFGFTIGWDMKDTAFSSANYINQVLGHFALALLKKARQLFIIELVDKGNQFGEMGFDANYTAKKFVENCKSVSKSFNGLILSGPGATPTASKEWYLENRDITWYCGLFSYRAHVFQNEEDMNISNLLSEKYTTEFWDRRFVTNDYNVLNDFDEYLGAINDFKITKDPKGKDGFTNTFAAAIFAIESTLEYYFRAGYFISFYNPIEEDSFQSPYGKAPDFAPGPLYYAMLFITLSTRQYPYIEKPTVLKGTSGSIKIYGLRYFGTHYGFIIINKDQNQNASGIVKVNIRDNSGVSCYYLQAPHLSSKNNITFGGVSFIGGNSTYQGNFSSPKYFVDGDNNYQIQVNYSQVVFCRTENTIRNYPFPRGTGKFQTHIYVSLLLVLFFILLS